MAAKRPVQQLLSGLGVPSRILICDNEEPMRALERASLAHEDYESDEARDGDEALEQARKLGPDLMVLVVQMPGRTGFEVLQELRADPELARTPVLMLTARAQASDREAAVEVGANRYLPKPFSPVELAAVVEELLSRPE
jgi:DNA-binding response OmpR family regulator